MDEGRHRLTREWLTKALHDLISARKLAADPDPVLDTAVYHCQQAAEKTVKGYLVFRDLDFEKTHDIQEIVALANEVEPAFAQWLDIAERLTPYSSLFRYPSGLDEPNREDFDEAMGAAESIHRFVLSLLPRATHPE